MDKFITLIKGNMLYFECFSRFEQYCLDLGYERYREAIKDKCAYILFDAKNKFCRIIETRAK